MRQLWQRVGVYFVPGLFGLGLAGVLGMWAMGSSVAGMSLGPPMVWVALASLTGLVAYYLVLWQLLLIGRVGWIERIYGHDRLSRWHHVNGLVAWGLIGLHPILMVVGFSGLNQTDVVSVTMSFLMDYQYVELAAIAYVMYMSIVLVSLTIVRRRMRYEWWYSVHFLLYGAVVLSLFHQLVHGMDLSHAGPQTFWWGMVGFVAVNLLYWRFGRPMWRWWRHDFRVARLEQEAPGVTSVYIRGRDLAQWRARAGQFVIVRFWAWPWMLEAHPFSLSGMPDGTELRLTIKAVGDFTSSIVRLSPGVRVVVDGPLGRFTSDRASMDVKVLLVAGGIGITPLRVLFEEMARAGRDVRLVYAARSEQDLALKDELDQLASERARVEYMPEDTRGRLTPERLRELVPDVAERTVWLCGPAPMMKAVCGQLIGLGVLAERIYFEKFELG